MTVKNFNVRRMTREELDLAVDWAAAEGWNPGRHDADPFFAADPHGFFLGALNDEPIGCISAVVYDEAFGFLGFYIVRPEYRGQGYGIQIWNTGMAYLGKRNVGLDGVVAQQANYQKSGFKLAYRNIRYQGTAGALGQPQGGHLVELTNVPFAELLAYDRSHFPAERPRFLRGWNQQPEGAALGVQRNGKLAGYGVLRPCRSGFKIGPLFADDERLAEELFAALTGRFPGAVVFLDTPEVNPAAVALARRYGMNPVFETARMYTKEPPDVPLSHIFGVTTFELG